MKQSVSILISIFILSGSVKAEGRLSWLPAGNDTETASPEINDLLRSLDGSMRIMGCRYDGPLLKQCGSMSGNGLRTASGKWEYDVATTSVAGEKNAFDLSFTFRHTGGDAEQAGVAVAFDFGSWNTDNYVLIPASVYNGNRNRTVKKDYCEGLDRSDLYRKDLPQTTAEIQQLSPNLGEVSRLEINTSYTTTPAICFFDKRKNEAFFILTEQGTPYGGKVTDNGLIIEENADRTQASLVVSMPGVPEKKPEFIGFSKSPYRGITWKDGEERTLRMRVYKFKAQDIPAVLDKFMAVRKSVTGQNTPRNLIPFSEVSRLMCINIDKRYYEGDNKFYRPENADWISFGWIGGLINTYPMLVMDDAMHRGRVRNTFDFGLKHAQAESGYYYMLLNHDGTLIERGAYAETPGIVLTRMTADVLVWMVKQFELLKAQGHAADIDPEWERRVARLADAFVSTWEKEGQWGNFIDIRTGDIALYNTSSGVSAIGGLALASKYYNEPRYMETAVKAADHYYADFVKYGMTTGGCGDIYQNSDSETAAAFMTSLMTLYELTGKKEWLERSRNLANLCATWTTSFDYVLAPETDLAKLGAKLTGAVWASTQNKHGAPGFCTLSGDPLFRIYRATGDERYASLMYDIAHAHAEGIQPNGHITERLTYCDADSKGSRLDGGKTGWNETNGALMATELPGIYVRTDIDRMFVFDHVTVKVKARDRSGVRLEITNPTRHDASVSVFAENKKEAQKPLGLTYFLGWPKVDVKAGETAEYFCPAK